jgi:lipopolysaccharide export system permease protein
MILGELFRVFSVSLVSLTGMILMAGIISEAMKNGMGPGQILIAIPLMLPSLLPYTVPTTTLFATCVVYGRLAADNELLALRAAGIHILHVVWPALLLGILTSAVTLFLYLDAIPYTSYALRVRLVEDVDELLYTILRRDGCLKHPKLNYEIHVNHVRGHKLEDTIFKRKAPDGKSYDFIARARQAELQWDGGAKKINIVMWQTQIVKGTTIGSLESNIWPVEVPSFFVVTSVKQRPCDMTWSELFEYDQKWQEEKGKISRDIDRHQVQIDRGRGEPNFRDHVGNLMNERKTFENQLFALHSEWHMRAAFAIGCFCFALVACPVGIWFSKSDYLSAFITCFLPIVTLYYPLMLCTINLARSGKYPPWVGIYAADLLLLIVGLFLFRRLARN